MSNKIVQLENEAGDNIYPLAGGALTGSISKTMLEEGVFEGPELSEPSTVAYVATDNIQDGAVTSDKIDYTTLPILYGDAQFNSDQSSTSEQTLIQRDISVPTTVRMMIQGFSVIKTSANTSALRIYIDGESMSGNYTTGTSNSTTPSSQIVCGWATLSPGTHTISLRLTPQDTSTTGTACAFRRNYLIGWCV